MTGKRQLIYKRFELLTHSCDSFNFNKLASSFYSCSSSQSLIPKGRMAVRLYCLCLLLVLLVPSQAKKQRCLMSNSKCDECIQSGPECAWCTAPHSNIRCHTLRGLRRSGCPEGHIYNPQGGVQVVKNGNR